MFSKPLAKIKNETKIKTSLRARGPPGVSGALCSVRILRIGRIGSAPTILLAWRWMVYDLQPYVRISLIQAMKEACDLIDSGSVQGWIRHSRRFFPHCLWREDVDEVLWPDAAKRWCWGFFFLVLFIFLCFLFLSTNLFVVYVLFCI